MMGGLCCAMTFLHVCASKQTDIEEVVLTTNAVYMLFTYFWILESNNLFIDCNYIRYT